MLKSRPKPSRIIHTPHINFFAATTTTKRSVTTNATTEIPPSISTTPKRPRRKKIALETTNALTDPVPVPTLDAQHTKTLKYTRKGKNSAPLTITSAFVPVETLTTSPTIATPPPKPLTNKPKRIKSLVQSRKEKTHSVLFDLMKDSSTQSVLLQPQQLTEEDITATRSQLLSVFDLSYQQFVDVMQQTNLLRYKVAPLKHMPTSAIHISPTYAKPLAGINTTLFHQFHGKKAQVDKYNHNMIINSNLRHIPPLLGGNEVQVYSTNGIDVIEIKLAVLRKLLKKYKIATPSNLADITDIDTQLDLASFLSDDQLAEFTTLFNKAISVKLAKNKTIGAQTDIFTPPDLLYLYNTTKDSIPYKQISAQYGLTTLPPTLTVASHNSSLVSLLSIFSLLPQTQLFTNPNSLKIAFIGMDYANHSFIPELIYLCQRLGINLSLSTPTNTTKLYNQNLIEQSQIAFNIIPSAPKKLKKVLKSKDMENELDIGNYNNDGDISEVSHQLLHPPLFFFDKAPGLSPFIRDIEQILAYRNHLTSVQHSAPAIIDEFENMIKQHTASKQKMALHNPFSSTKAKKSADSSILPTRPFSPIIEYVQHPFSAIQQADIVITNSVYCATTWTHTEHESYEIDKEMLSFAKDNAKLFHMTEGYYPWTEPILGLHDPRCMFEKQTANESYIIAALSLILTNKKLQ